MGSLRAVVVSFSFSLVLYALLGWAWFFQTQTDTTLPWHGSTRFSQADCTPVTARIVYEVEKSLFPRESFRDITPELEDQRESSFGFYYPSPFSADSSSVLTMTRDKVDHPPGFRSSIDLAVHNVDSGTKMRSLGATQAFNIPMGARAQWVGNSRNVIFNIRRQVVAAEVSFGARVVDTTTGKTKLELDAPIFSVDKRGKRATSLNFARVLCFSAEGTYGYQVEPRQATKCLNQRIPSDDGISVADLDSPESRPQLVITPRRLVDWMIAGRYPIYTDRTRAGDWLNSCYVWLEQPLLDDSGSRILFMARAKCFRPSDTLSVTNVQKQKYINLGIFTVGRDGSDLWYANGAPVSHFDFAGTGPNQLLLCGNEGMLLTQDRVDGGVMLSSGDLTDGGADRFAGHCTLARHDSNLILTDTSCTKCTVDCTEHGCGAGHQGRYFGILNIRARKLQLLGLFRTNTSIPEPLFIDLHPRFSPNGRFISIDSAHSSKGSRQYILDLEANAEPKPQRYSTGQSKAGREVWRAEEKQWKKHGKRDSEGVEPRVHRVAHAQETHSKERSEEGEREEGRKREPARKGRAGWSGREEVVSEVTATKARGGHSDRGEVEAMLASAALLRERLRGDAILFYMYEPSLFKAFERCDTSKIPDMKHAVDVFFVEQLQQHPWRVAEHAADTAKVFVVPALLTYAAVGKCGKIEPLIDDLEAVLGRQPLYQRHPSRHLVLGGHYKLFKFHSRLDRRQLVLASHSRQPDRVITGGTRGSRYVNNPYLDYYAGAYELHKMHGSNEFSNAEHKQPREKDLLFSWMGMDKYVTKQGLTSLLFRDGTWFTSEGLPHYDRTAIFRSRHTPDGKQTWSDTFVTTNVVNKQESPLRKCAKTPAFDSADRCLWMPGFHQRQAMRIMERSNFSLVLGSDMPVSDRQYNAIAALSIPVFVHDGEQDLVWHDIAFPNIFPWREVSFAIARKAFQADPYKEMQKLRSLVRHRGDLVLAKYRLMEQHLPDMVWSHPQSRCAINILREAVALMDANASNAVPPSGDAPWHVLQ